MHHGALYCWSRVARPLFPVTCLKSMKGCVDNPSRGVLQTYPCTDASMKGRVDRLEFLAPRFSWGTDAN